MIDCEWYGVDDGDGLEVCDALQALAAEFGALQAAPTVADMEALARAIGE